MVYGKLDFNMQKYEIKSLNKLHPKNQTINNLNVGTETIKLLKRT
jgi:hypothetical protein